MSRNFPEMILSVTHIDFSTNTNVVFFTSSSESFISSCHMTKLIPDAVCNSSNGRNESQKEFGKHQLIFPI